MEKNAVAQLGQTALDFWVSTSASWSGCLLKACNMAPAAGVLLSSPARVAPAQATAYASLGGEMISCCRGKCTATDCTSTLSHQQLPFLPCHFFFFLPISALYAMLLLAKQMIVEGT